jgi:hypothetical protein
MAGGGDVDATNGHAGLAQYAQSAFR